MVRGTAIVFCVLGMLAAAAQAVPVMPNTDGLVAYYLFDEASGSTVLDGKGNAGNNGTMVGDTIARVATTPFVYAGNTAMSFDAGSATLTTDDDYVAIPVSTNTLNFLKTSAFSISLWFKTNTTAVGSLVSRATNSTPQYNILVKGGSTPGPVAAIVNGGTGGSTSGAYNDGNWHSVVLSYSGTAGKIYVDGMEAVSTFAPGSNSGTSIDTLIGARRNNATANSDSAAAFTGLIDDVAFFNYAVSAGEAAWLASNSVAAIPEPMTLGLLALGGLFVARRRR